MVHLLVAILSFLIYSSFLWAGEREILQEVDWLYLERNQRSKAEQALALLQRERQSDPENPEILWRLARTLKWEGDQKESRSDKITLYERAVAMARRGVEVNPKSIGGHFWLGVSMGKVGESRGLFRSLFLIDPIKKEMQTVLSLNPGHGGAHLVLGVMYRKLPGFLGGSNKRSIEELKKAISLEARRTLPYLELAITYREEDQDRKAAEMLHSLIAIADPVDPIEARVDKEEAKEMLSNLK